MFLFPNEVLQNKLFTSWRQNNATRVPLQTMMFHSDLDYYFTEQWDLHFSHGSNNS